MAGFTGLLPKNSYGDIPCLNNSGSGIPATLANVKDGLGNATGLCLSSTQVGFGTTADNGMKRLAAGVIAVTDGSTGGGWLQQLGGEGCLAANFTDATGTLAVTALSFTVKAGRSYRIKGALKVSNTTAADGFQCDFAGGTATATTFWMGLASIGSVVAGTVVSAALNTALFYSTTTGTDIILASGFLTVNAAGTFIMRAASNTHVAGTMTLAAGSWLALTDVAAL